MKKFFVLTLVFIVMLSSVCYAGNAVITFDPDKFSADVFLEIGGESDEIVTISMWQGIGDIPGDRNADFAGLHMTENGILDEEILIPYTLKSGKNTICINSISYSESLPLLIINPTDSASVEAAKTASTIENASDMYDFLVNQKKGLLLGIDVEDEALRADMNDICKILVNEAGAMSADTPLSFYNSFCASYAMHLLKNGSDADSIFETYGKYMGMDYEEYNGFDTKIKTKTADLMKKSDVSNKSISAIYADSLLLASITLLDNLEDFTSQIEENTVVLGIDMGSGSDYSKIKKSLRYKVFVKTFEIRDSFTSLEDVAESFDDIVYDVLKSSNISSGSSSSSSGSSSGKKISTSGVVSTPVVQPDISADVDQTTFEIFSDISGHYSEECVTLLASQNIINGYADGTFKPDNLVTRAEFSKIISTALKLASSASEEYDDVSSADWFCESVSAMSNLGFIKGYNGLFNPEAPLTRQDAAVIAVRILKYYGLEIIAADVDYADASLISEYALDSVGMCESSGIMTGSDSYFRALDSIKRGEAAIVVNRIMNKING